MTLFYILLCALILPHPKTQKKKKNNNKLNLTSCYFFGKKFFDAWNNSVNSTRGRHQLLFNKQGTFSFPGTATANFPRFSDETLVYVSCFSKASSDAKSVAGKGPGFCEGRLKEEKIK